MQRCLWYERNVLLVLLMALAHQQAVTLHKQCDCTEKRRSRIGMLMVKASSCEGIICTQL